MWARLRELEHEVETYREGSERLQGELRTAQTELRDYRAREHAIAHEAELAQAREDAIAAEAEQRAQAHIAEAETAAAQREEAARARAAVLVTEAEGQAEQVRAAAHAEALERGVEAEQEAQRIRSAAEEEAAQVRAGLDREAAQARQDAELRFADANRELAGLLRLKDDLLRNVRNVIDELDHVTSRFERGEETPLAPLAALPAGEDSAVVPWPVNGAVPGEHLFDKRVELDAGPIGDFGKLSEFERSLARLPSVSDVYVRRYADDRAVIEVTLARPAALLRAMSQSLPYSFDVESVEGDKVKINVAAPLAAAR